MVIPVVYMLVGLLCSGKTTYRKKYLNHLSFLSTDNELEKYALANNLTYSEAFETHYARTETAMYQYVKKLTSFGKYSCVWDQTNLSRKARKNKLAYFDGYYKVGIIFPSPTMEQFELRNENRSNKISKEVFKRLEAVYEPVTKEEDFNELRYPLK